MKTYKNLYKRLLDKDHIKETLLRASKRKKYRDAVRRKIDVITDAVHAALVCKEFRLRPTINRPVHDRKKVRDITISPYFPNKAYDYLITEELKPIIQKSMYRWCVGNVKGRGLDMCINYCKRAVHKYRYCLQLDIKKFYDSIDKAILFKKVARKVGDRDFLNFYRQVIGSRGRGLPLGLNSSQWLSNYYLQDMDYYITQKLHAPAYVRYVDNLWIFASNKRKLHHYRKQIAKYFGAELHLSIKETYQIFNLEKGDEIEVLGYKLSRGFTRLNKPTLYKIKRLYFRMKKRLSVRRARSIISLMGWLRRTTNYTKYLTTRIVAVADITLKQIKQLLRRKLQYEKPASSC